MKKALLLVGTTLLAGCASTQYSVQPPAPISEYNKTKEIARPKDAVWDDAVAALGQRFFVINNLEKSSGLVNVSYSGDPEKYVDCGTVTVVTKGPGGRTSTFKGAAADTIYMATAAIPPYGMPAPVRVRRQTSLEGRVNLIFESIDANRTRVTAATRYVLSRKISPDGNAMLQSSSDTASFNANEKGYFPASFDGRALECVSTGALESSILDLVK